MLDHLDIFLTLSPDANPGAIEVRIQGSNTRYPPSGQRLRGLHLRCAPLKTALNSLFSDGPALEELRGLWMPISRNSVGVDPVDGDIAMSHLREDHGRDH